MILLFGCGKTTDVTTPEEAAAPDAVVTDTAEAASEENETAAPVDAGQLDFATTDINGDPFTVHVTTKPGVKNTVTSLDNMGYAVTVFEY